MFSYLRRGFEVPEAVQALWLPGRGVSGKETVLWLKKHNIFTLGEVLKFQRPSKLFDSLEGESLGKRMASEAGSRSRRRQPPGRRPSNPIFFKMEYLKDHISSAIFLPISLLCLRKKGKLLFSWLIPLYPFVKMFFLYFSKINHSYIADFWFLTGYELVGG